MNLLTFITYAGIFVFALTGAFKARTYKMDVFGGIVVAFVTAYGGGTVRDLLLGIKPVNWINDNIAFFLVSAGAFFTFLLKENVSKFKRTIFYTDVIGLGFFTAWGIEVAQRSGANDLYALVMGVITATFGGLCGDIICNSIPNLLKRGELYATACAIGGAVYLLFERIPVEHNLNLLICVLVVAGVRIYSKRKRLMLPDI